MKKFIIILSLLSSGCTDRIYEVNKQINSYKYIPSTNKHLKTLDEFYKDGGGNCKDFANAKKTLLGGELVMYPYLYPINGTLRSHVVLKVNGWLLDNRTNNLRPANTIITYLYKG